MKRTLLGAAAGLPGGAVFGAAIGAFLTNGIVPELLLPYIAGGAGLGLIAGAIAGDPKKVFGSKNERELKRLRPLVQRINDFEEALTALSDEELRAKTEHFRAVLARATQPEREELERLRGELREAHRQGGEALESLREAIKEQEDAVYQAEMHVLDEICWSRPSPASARPRAAPSGCATTTCS